MEADNVNREPQTLEEFITAKRAEKKQIKMRIKKHFVFLSVLLTIPLVILLSPLRVGVVLGDSMEPTLKSDEVFLYNSRSYNNALPSKNEVIIFKQDKDILIKRVVGLPREWIWYYTVDGELRQSYVPDKTVFVLGDNVKNSLDSRTFGPITISSILGKVTYPNMAQIRPFN